MRIFKFLNVEGDLDQLSWSAPDMPALWRFNLHYFDDLNAEHSETRHEWHKASIADWIASNEPGVGIGWDVYPTSLRITNWVKWILSGNDADESMLNSLATQADLVFRSPEYHLLGNHLLANAKALIFAGMLFDGPKAQHLLGKGWQILDAQVDDQILGDGGHVERSPMYHAIVLEDLMDIVNLYRCYGLKTELNESVGRMLEWFEVMRFNDGTFPRFNDTAEGITPSVGEIQRYSREVFELQPDSNHAGIVHLRESGYISIRNAEAQFFADIGSVGPDYLPAHAHAGTLSYELALRGQQVVVNTGTSVYGAGERRCYERSTDAHTTITIDGQNSSEVWGGFRVARRAKIFNAQVNNTGDGVQVSASHDGYRRLSGNPVHERRWVIGETTTEIEDRVTSKLPCNVATRTHLHPSLSVVREGEFKLRVVDAGGVDVCELGFDSVDELWVETYQFAAGFGDLRNAMRICTETRFLPASSAIRTRIKWQA